MIWIKLLFILVGLGITMGAACESKSCFLSFLLGGVAFFYVYVIINIQVELEE